MAFQARQEPNSRNHVLIHMNSVIFKASHGRLIPWPAEAFTSSPRTAVNVSESAIWWNCVMSLSPIFGCLGLPPAGNRTVNTQQKVAGPRRSRFLKMPHPGILRTCSLLAEHSTPGKPIIPVIARLYRHLYKTFPIEKLCLPPPTLPTSPN